MRRTNTRFAVTASAVALLMAAPVRTTVAEGPAEEAEELRKELRQLRSQVATMKAALSEAAEYDRMRTAALGRALQALGGPLPEGAALPPAKDAPEAEPKAVGRPVAAAPRRAPAPAPVAEPVGVIRGKVDVPSGEPVAYVYVENIRGPSVKGQKVRIDQVNKQFVPAWAVVQRGTTIEFPNRDNIYHNVFSLSSGNSFDLGLYNSGSEPKGHTFEEPGSADIYCNIHPQMAASVLVVPSRYHAKVKADGTFEIPGVPSGKRKIVAWAPGSRLSADWVELAPGATAEIDLRLERKAAGHKNKNGRAYGSYE